MNLVKYILNKLRPGCASKRAFRFDLPLARQIQAHAAEEKRPAGDVAAELLHYALKHRQEAERRLHLWKKLTEREQQVAALVCLGGKPLTNRKIGERLVISPETVKTHIRSILYKFDLHSKAELGEFLTDWDFSETEG